jgi:small subunit ribosomal protein S6
MHDYEITFILNPNLADDEATANTERISTLITNGGGEIVDVHPWGGKRRLAYPIEHHRDGYYVTTKFRAMPETAYGLDAQIRINDNVMRHLVVRMDPSA